MLQCQNRLLVDCLLDVEVYWILWPLGLEYRLPWDRGDGSTTSKIKSQAIES
jgi:hypothetical protein